MPRVWDRLEQPGGALLASLPVLVRLKASSTTRAAAGFRGGANAAAIVAERRATTDAGGVWHLDLDANNAITPVNTVWVVTRDLKHFPATTSTIQVPAPRTQINAPGGITLPQATITVDSTAAAGVNPGFAASGSIRIGNQVIAYTGVTATTFTGCTGGVGAVADDAEVLQPDGPSTTQSTGFTVPSSGTFTVSNLASTTGFFDSGYAAIGATVIVRYAAKTSTTLTGCTAIVGAGVVVANGATVSQAYHVGQILSDPPAGLGSLHADASTAAHQATAVQRTAGSWMTAVNVGAALDFIEARRGAADGLASTDATTRVPAAQLGTGTADSTTVLGGDRAFRQITDAQVAAANKDGATGVASMRTLGTGAQQAAQGSATVNLTGDQTVAGEKRLTGRIVVSADPWLDPMAADYGGGAVFDGVTDDAAALTALINFVNGRRGARISLPHGHSKILSALPAITKPVIIQGAASTATLYPTQGGTVLDFAVGIGGLQLAGESQKSRISDLLLMSAASSAGSDHGLWLRRHGCVVDNVTVVGFSGHGVFVDGTASNANLCSIRATRAAANKGDGFRLQGSDANVVTLLTCSSVGNLNGFNFRSAHCVAVNCQADANTDAAYRDAGGTNAWYRPYAESSATFVIESNSTYGRLEMGLYAAPTIVDQTPAGGGWIIEGIDGRRGAFQLQGVGGATPRNYEWRSRGNIGSGYLELVDRTRSAYIADIDPNGIRWAMRLPVEFVEQADPVAPPADRVRLYCRDDGAGKTQLVARFATGAVQVIATQP